MPFERDFSDSVAMPVKVDDAETGSEPTTFLLWLNSIIKGSFATLSMDDLNAYNAELHHIFESITFVNESVRYYSSKYNIDIINSNIRKAFSEILKHTCA